VDVATCVSANLVNANTIQIEFLGVWDSGRIPMVLPHPRNMWIVKKFRHALAIDNAPGQCPPLVGACGHDRARCDEVWFAGTYNDIDGPPTHKVDSQVDLTPGPWRTTLMWMIAEALQMDPDCSLSLDTNRLGELLPTLTIDDFLGGGYATGHKVMAVEEADSCVDVSTTGNCLNCSNNGHLSPKYFKLSLIPCDANLCCVSGSYQKTMPPQYIEVLACGRTMFKGI